MMQLNQPIAVVSIDTVMTVEATNAAPSATDAAQAPPRVTTNNPAASWVNQILRIGETDVRNWTSHLDSSIRMKSWESL